MKRAYNIIISIILVLVFHLAHAQKFGAGIFAGLAHTDVIGVDPYDEDFLKVGVLGGAFVNLPVSEKSVLQMEIMYIQKGTLQPADSTNYSTYYKMKLDYIEVPLLIKRRIHFTIREKPIDKFEIEGGFSFGALLHVTQLDQYGVFPDAKPFGKVDASIQLGAAYYFTKHIALDLRFSNSVIPFRKNVTRGAIYWFNNDEYNTVLSYSLRYIF